MIDSIWKKIADFYNNTNLVLRIITGIILGCIAGFLFPGCSWIDVLGDLFVGALKAIAPILVFVLVVSSISQGNKDKETSDGRLRTVIFLYLLSTLLASLTAVGASFINPQTLILSVDGITSYSIPAGLGEVIHNLLINIVVNPIASLTEGNYLGILFWAIIFGISARTLVSDETKKLFSDISDCVSAVVKWVINLAPLGIMGLVFAAISSNGADIFNVYGKLIIMLAGCMLFVYFVVNPIIIFSMIRINPYPLITKCFKESGLTAFFTRSSAANIPINMTLCEKLGLDKDMYSVSIPLGATINMNGAAVTISIMTLAVVHTLGIPVTLPTALCLSVLSAFAACGASGIAGGSLLLIPMACSLFGIPNEIAIEVVGVGFVIGVIQDSIETALNSSCDVVFTATAEFYKRKKDGKELPKI